MEVPLQGFIEKGAGKPDGWIPELKPSINQLDGGLSINSKLLSSWNWFRTPTFTSLSLKNENK